MINSTQNSNSNRAGFTLVELLVSIGLLVLIMSIFAQIFALASGTIITQRGIAQNNQKARTIFTLVSGSDTARGDLKNLTYKPISGEGGITPMSFGVTPNSNQIGYLFISENDPTDQTDDRIQFTTEIPIAASGEQQLYYYGRAASLPYNNGSPTNTNQTDHMDWDDGVPGDSSSRSRKAEITYFMRRGTLYRRVILIRTPADPLTGESTDEALGDPTRDSSPNISFFNPTLTPTGNRYNASNGANFYTDFDFSGHFDSSGESYVRIHSTLENTGASFPLGNSRFRFGFNHANGLPREYVNVSGTPNHIGCFTHEETSNLDFQYPHSNTGTYNNPFSNTTFTINNDGNITQLQNGSRKAEDILLTNVLEFDVKVWDEEANGGDGGFVDIGGSSAVDLAASNDQNNSYGSSGPSGNNVYDTWHTDMDHGSKISPYRRFFIRNFVTTVPTATEARIWAPNTTVTAGEYFIPSEEFYVSQGFDSATRHAIIYRATNNGETGITPVVTPGTIPSPDEPAWTPTEFVAGENVVGVGNPVGVNVVVWEEVHNVKPLRAIQLKFLYKDPGTRQIRQVTIVKALSQ